MAAKAMTDQKDTAVERAISRGGKSGCQSLEINILRIPYFILVRIEFRSEYVSPMTPGCFSNLGAGSRIYIRFASSVFFPAHIRCFFNFYVLGC